MSVIGGGVSPSSVATFSHREKLQSPKKNFFKRFLAFTLAETLIVMGIIGIVSALTLPNLNSSTGEKEKVAKLQKIYQNLNDAFGRAQAIYGPISEWNTSNGNSSSLQYNPIITDRVSEFLKISKTCPAKSAGCFKNGIFKNYRGEDPDTISNWNFGNAGSYPRILLADGTSVFIQHWSKTCDGAKAPDGSRSVCGWITVDIDGPTKGSNQVGKDIFMFDFSETYGVYPFGSFQEDYVPSDIYNKCFSKGNGCTAWVIDFGNMDYLNADASGKCKNNTSIVLDGVTNTTCK